MARNLGDIEQAIANGSGVESATMRSTLGAWGVVLPTQTRSQRASEAVNNLEARANYARELQGRGGRWRYSARRIAIEILGLINLYNEWFIDYEPTASGSDSSGATSAIPFGDWADVDARVDIASITAIAEQELPQS